MCVDSVWVRLYVCVMNVVSMCVYFIRLYVLVHVCMNFFYGSVQSNYSKLF